MNLQEAMLLEAGEYVTLVEHLPTSTYAELKRGAVLRVTGRVTPVFLNQHGELEAIPKAWKRVWGPEGKSGPRVWVEAERTERTDHVLITCEAVETRRVFFFTEEQVDRGVLYSK